MVTSRATGLEESCSQRKDREQARRATAPQGHIPFSTHHECASPPTGLCYLFVLSEADVSHLSAKQDLLKPSQEDGSRLGINKVHSYYMRMLQYTCGTVQPYDQMCVTIHRGYRATARLITYVTVHLRHCATIRPTSV